MENKELYRRAVEAMKNSYAPFSKFTVGAVLLTKDGKLFTGVNVENSSFGGTICAERTAYVKAVSEGFREFDRIAIACNEGAAWPCGICRQFMYEFGSDLKVITGDDEENLKMMTLQELLPEGFKL
ncbi:MAG: cytidine deaminase [Peptostreptococcaceae bacterium]|nr:cytidine deaminase [Peptostreptococcaceae bacterium]